MVKILSSILCSAICAFDADLISIKAIVAHIQPFDGNCNLLLLLLFLLLIVLDWKFFEVAVVDDDDDDVDDGNNVDEDEIVVLDIVVAAVAAADAAIFALILFVVDDWLLLLQSDLGELTILLLLLLICPILDNWLESHLFPVFPWLQLLELLLELLLPSIQLFEFVLLSDPPPTLVTSAVVFPMITSWALLLLLLLQICWSFCPGNDVDVDDDVELNVADVIILTLWTLPYLEIFDG